MNHAVVCCKKWRSIYLKLYPMREFKNENSYYYAKSELLSKIRLKTVFEIQISNRFVVERIFCSLKRYKDQNCRIIHYDNLDVLRPVHSNANLR